MSKTLGHLKPDILAEISESDKGKLQYKGNDVCNGQGGAAADINMSTLPQIDFTPSNDNATLISDIELGKALPLPADTWKRYDNLNTNLVFTGSWKYETVSGGSYSVKIVASTSVTDTLELKFVGTKLRLIGRYYNSGRGDQIIEIDGKEYIYTQKGSLCPMSLDFHISGLDDTLHTVKITRPDHNGSYYFDALDIDDNGELVDISTVRNDIKFPVKVGSDSNITPYSASLLNGEEHLIVSRNGRLYLTDGKGGYKECTLKLEDDISSFTICNFPYENTSVIQYGEQADLEPYVATLVNGEKYFLITLDGNTYFTNGDGTYITLTESKTTNINYKIGDMALFAVPPDENKWVKCDGRRLITSDYPELFKEISQFSLSDVDWINRNSGHTSVINRVKYVKDTGLFVAFGNDNIITSEDGIQWTKSVNYPTYNYTDMVYVDGYYIFFTDAGPVQCTEDFLSYNVVTKTPSFLKIEKAYIDDNTIYVCGRTSATRIYGCYELKAGDTSIDITYGSLSGVYNMFNIDGFNVITKTTHTSNWIVYDKANPKTYSSLAGRTTKSYTNAIVKNGNVYVAATSKGLFISTNECESWFLIDPSDMQDVVYVNNCFIAVSNDGNIITSIDGLNWSAENSNTIMPLHSIAVSDEVAVAVGDDGAIVSKLLDITTFKVPDVNDYTYIKCK